MTRRVRHLTPGYVLRRADIWLWERRNPDLPWLTRSAVEFLSDWLRDTDRGLEFGSGRSTIWFARTVGHLTSVEIDEAWYAKVRDGLRQAGVDHKVDLRLHADQAAWLSDPASSSYVQVAHSFPDGSLDFCLVDGWARGHCASAVLPKLRPGGLLVIDDTDTHAPRPSGRRVRPATPNLRNAAAGPKSEVWGGLLETLADWRCFWTTNGKKDTAFWFKPCS